MDAGHNIQSHIPSHPEVPKDARLGVVEAQRALFADDVALLAGRASRIDELTGAREQKLTDLLGGEVRAALDEIVAAGRRDAEQRLKDVPPERAEKVRRAMQDEGRHTIEAFASEHGVDLDAVREAAAESDEDLTEAMQIETSKDVATSVPDEEVPEDIRDQSHNPPVVFRAPFPGWAYSWAWQAAGYSWRGDRFLREGIGEFGNHIEFNTPTNGGNYSGTGHYAASVGFWYQMPTPGRIDAWLEVERVGGGIDQWMRWDYIFPWSWPRGSSQALQNVVMVTQGQRSGSSSEIRGYVDSRAQTYPRYPSAGSPIYNWFHLFSDRAYEAGEWVLVWVGLRNDISSTSNDIHLRNASGGTYLLRSARVQSTGGG